MTQNLFDSNADYIPLEPSLLSIDSQELEKGLHQRIVGQDRAVTELVRCYQMFRSGLHRADRPMGVLLFLGPTGSGKTRLVEAFAECLFGRKEAVIKIDCAEFQQEHEVAKLIGSPPGYLGHKTTPSRLSQEILDKCHRPSLKMSILLFDEIEKAADEFHQLLLGILDTGTLTLGNNEKVDFSKTLIVMTSNEGSSALQKIANRNGLGFMIGQDADSDIDQEILDAAKGALEKKFSPEFRNRIGQVIVFQQLNDAALEKITDIELGYLQDRMLSAGYFILLRVTDAAKAFVRKQGTDPIYGARHLNRAIDRYLSDPIASLIGSKQIGSRDLLTADYKEGDKLSFTKLEGVVEPPPPPQYESEDIHITE